MLYTLSYTVAEMASIDRRGEGGDAVETGGPGLEGTRHGTSPAKGQTTEKDFRKHVSHSHRHTGRSIENPVKVSHNYER